MPVATAIVPDFKKNIEWEYKYGILKPKCQCLAIPLFKTMPRGSLPDPDALLEKIIKVLQSSDLFRSMPIHLSRKKDKYKVNRKSITSENRCYETSFTTVVVRSYLS